MKEETKTNWRDCPRCKAADMLAPTDSGECWVCQNRDEEERKAWVQFASARLTPAATDGCLLYFSPRDAAQDANDMLEEWGKRWPYPAKEVK